MNSRFLFAVAGIALLTACGGNDDQQNQQYPQQGYNQNQPQQQYDQNGNPIPLQGQQQGYNNQQMPQQAQQQAPMPTPTVTKTVAAAAPTTKKSSSGNKMTKCSIEIGTMVDVTSTCEFIQYGGDGSFELYDKTNMESVKVDVTSPGVATVYYDGTSGWVEQGQVRRKGACWQGNPHGDWISICAG